MTIDTLTLALVQCILALLLTVGVCAHLRHFKDMPGIRLFTIGNIVHALAAVGLLLRFRFAESQALVFVSNTLLLGAFSCFYVGLLRFLGRRENIAFIAVLSVFFFAGIGYFTFFDDQISYRIVVYSIVLCLYTGVASLRFLTSRRPEYTNTVRALGVYLLLCFAFSAARGAAALAAPVIGSFGAPSAFLYSAFLVGITGVVVWTFILVMLVSERVAAEKKEAQERLQTIYEAIPEAVSLSEFDTGILVEANERFLEKLDLPKSEVLGKKTTELGFWGGEEKRRDYIELLRRDGRVENHEIFVRKKDGTSFIGLLSSRPIELRGEKYIISSFRDIDERKRLESELERQASTDALTGIANRRHFYETLRQEILRCEMTGSRAVFLMLDIDGFKRINDSYGHQLGDVALKMVAQAIRAVLRASDLLGRVGGDEFGVLLINTDPAVSGKVAEKIRRKVERLELEADADTPVYLTVSIGYTTYRSGDRADTVEELIARADTALYQAKEQGRNRVVEG